MAIIPTITTLHNLLDYDASKLSGAELQLKNCLPGWINVASSVKLKAVLQKYLDFVQGQLEKIQAFFDDEKISSLSLSSRVMQAFIDDFESNSCTGLVMISVFFFNIS